MSENDTKGLTELLLQSSRQHLRLTLEQLDIGTLSVNKAGDIESVDRYTEQVLEMTKAEILHRNIRELFEDSATNLLEQLNNKTLGHRERISLRTKSGTTVSADAVLCPGVTPHLLTFSLVFSLDSQSNCAES